MKKILATFFVLLLLIGHENIIFASYKNEEVFDEEMEHYLQEIFDTRIDIWNGFMRGEYVSIEAVIEDLQEHIMEPLLTTDVEIYTDLLQNPASYEMIEQVKIITCKEIKKYGNKREYNVKVLWTIQDYEEILYEEIEYRMELRWVKNKWMLSDYQLK
ncbi:hypothetical protein [Natronincola ferrireducens]|uniref:Uncharacterized protein n=1 Tax=Natronincola ferrireducens TaxID=393762 RepID=A0A1G9A4B9_9FIRM|nr:hypothetical protein [Natronincola ferrireducens]SDK22212.1 hypothetical protein SAMN05660472_01057 [Natronincola ferrireducens]